MSVILRQALPTDLDEMLAVNPGLRVCEQNALTGWVVAVIDKKIVGMMLLSLSRPINPYRMEYACDLFVHPEYRRKGIAILFLNEVFNRHANRGIIWQFPVDVLPMFDSACVRQILQGLSHYTLDRCVVDYGSYLFFSGEKKNV